MMYNYKIQSENKSTVKLSLIKVFSVFLLSSLFLFYGVSSKDSESSGSLFNTGNLLLIFLVVFLILTFLVITENPIVEFLINNYKLTIISSVFLFLLILFISTDTFKSITGFMFVVKPTTTTTTPEILEQTQKLDFIPDVINTLEITNPQVVITRIDIEVYNKANNVKIDVSRLDSKPDYVIKDVSGVVYQYIIVEKTNLKDENIKGVKIKFHVEKSWLTKNEIDKSTVALYRYQDDTWIKLSTQIVSEDDNNVNYEVDTGRLSLFAIAGESKSPEKTISTTTTVNLNITTTTGTIASTATTKTTTTTITSTTIIFERNLDCQKCGQHKVPPLTEVKMTITATVSNLIQNTLLIDYYPSEWTVTDTNGGTTSVFNSNYNKIEWNIDSVSGSVSRWYFIKSPQRTLPSTKYYFFSEMEKQQSDTWDVIVSDPTEVLAQPYNCNDAKVSCVQDIVKVSNPDGSKMMINYQKPVNFFNDSINQWQAVNSTLGSSSCTINYNYCVVKGVYEAHFKSDPTVAETVRYFYNTSRKDEKPHKTGYVVYQPLSLNYRNDLGQVQQINITKAVKGAPESNKFTYPNVFGNGYNVSYEYLTDGIKENLILLSKNILPAPEKYIIGGGNPTLDFDFLIDYSDNLGAYINGVLWDKKSTVTTSNRVDFKDSTTGSVLLYLPKPYAEDFNETNVSTQSLKYQFKKTGSKFYVVLKTPYSWLNDSTRVYPITIDPTTKIEYNTTVDYYSINNTLNDYYFNATDAEQRINDIQNYWAKNDVCIGLYFGNRWHEFCGDSFDWVWYNSTNFKTYMNLTGTAELSYANYTVDTKVEYYLGQDYPEVLGTLTFYNIGNKDIIDSYIKVKTHDIKVNLTYDNDTFRVNTTSFWEAWSGWKQYFLDQSGLDLFYTENDLASRKYSIFDNSTESWVELNWNNSYWKNGIGNSMNYNLTVKKGSEINAPIDLVLLTGNVNKNDVITTNFKWADAIRQNPDEVKELFDKAVEIQLGWILDSYENGTEYYLRDMNVTIEMKPDKTVDITIKMFNFSELIKNSIRNAEAYSFVPYKFSCSDYSIGTYCPTDEISDKEITFRIANYTLQLPIRPVNFSFIPEYLLVNNKTGVLMKYDMTFKFNDKYYNHSSLENEIYRIGRVKFPHVFDLPIFEEDNIELSVNFPHVTDTSYCIDFPIERFSNLIINVTLPDAIKNYTFGRPEFIIENYTIGNSVIAHIRPYPCCGITKVSLQPGEVCSV